MNHTYASLTPSDSDDMDSNTSTPTFESPPSPARRNAIRELIASYEKQMKDADALRIPADVKQRLIRKYSSDNSDEAAKRVLNRQLSVDSNISNKEMENGFKNTSQDSFDQIDFQKKQVKAELTRTLTEIRKNYVRRVCSTVRKNRDKETDESPHLFECCLLVELDMAAKTPYVKRRYPADVSIYCI